MGESFFGFFEDLPNESPGSELGEFMGVVTLINFNPFSCGFSAVGIY